MYIFQVNSRTILKHLFKFSDGCRSCEVCQVHDEAEMRRAFQALSTSWEWCCRLDGVMDNANQYWRWDHSFVLTINFYLCLCHQSSEKTMTEFLHDVVGFRWKIDSDAFSVSLGRTLQFIRTKHRLRRRSLLCIDLFARSTPLRWIVTPGLFMFVKNFNFYTILEAVKQIISGNGSDTTRQTIFKGEFKWLILLCQCLYWTL